MDHFVIHPGRKITGGSTEHRPDDVGIDRRQPAGEGAALGPTMSTVSPTANAPSTPSVPAGSRLFGRSVSARSAPASTWYPNPSPRRRRRSTTCAPTGSDRAPRRRADEFRGHGASQHIGSRRVGDHRTHPRPRRHPAAVSFDAMPPLPRPLPPASARMASRGSPERTSGINVADGIAARIGGVHAVHVRQQHEHVGADTVRDQGSEPVVVAVPQLVVGDGVVLVDHRHTTQLQQPIDGVARGGRYWVRSAKSCGSSRTWAPTMPWRANSRLYASTRRLWPAAEIACSVCMSVGRAARPSAATPAARPRRHHDHLMATGAERCHLVGELGQRPGIDGATLIGDRRGADLCDHSHDSDP